MPDHFCNKCDKLMTDKKGQVLIGLTLDLNKINSFDVPFVDEQFGSYIPSKRYELCIDCFLSALGIVP